MASPIPQKTSDPRSTPLSQTQPIVTSSVSPNNSSNNILNINDNNIINLQQINELNNNMNNNANNMKDNNSTFENYNLIGILNGEDLEKIITSYQSLPKKQLNQSLKSQSIKYLSDFTNRRDLIDIIPPLCIHPLRGGGAVSTMKGPYHSSAPIQSFGDHACCLAKSLYPSRENFHLKDGDPIADRYFVQLFENRVISTIASGCSWGERARRSAKKACKAISLFLAKKNREMKSLRDVSQFMIEGFGTAHRKILEASEEGFWESGTTTLIASMIVRLNNEKNSMDLLSTLPSNYSTALTSSLSPWVLVVANLGNCKCFLYSKNLKKFKEVLTVQSPDQFFINGDPGGRLGAHHSDGKPDLRNLFVNYYPCEEGDIVILVSDGIYNNLDPKHQGINPKDFGLTAKPNNNNNNNNNVPSPNTAPLNKNNINNIKNNQVTNWDDVDPVKAMPIYIQFIEQKIKSIFNKFNVEDFNVQSVSQHLVNYCYQLTEKSRKFMLNNPNQRIPSDFTVYPGKVDHCSIVAFQVGEVTLSYNQWMGKGDPPPSS